MGFTILQWFTVALSLLGNYFVNKQKKIGLIIWMVANIIWIIIFFIMKSWPQAMLFFIYALFCVHGIYNWIKIEKEKTNEKDKTIKDRQ